MTPEFDLKLGYQSSPFVHIEGSTGYSRKVVDKIQSFVELPDGWDFGRGHAPSHDVVARAIYLHLVGSQYLALKSDAFPSPDGAIIVEFYRGETSVEVTVRPDRTLGLVKEQGTGSQYTQELSLDEADYETVLNELEALAMFASRGHTEVTSWNLLDYSTPASMHLTSGGLEVTQ